MFIFGARKFPIPVANGSLRKTGARKPAPENGVDLWRRFLERV